MKVCRRKSRILVLAVIALAITAGCPLPYEYNGPGGGNLHTSDPSTPSLTAPVTVSYSAQGQSGTISNNGTFTSGQTTTVTLSTATLNAVIYYTNDGTQVTNFGTAQKINGSSGQITITRSTSVQTLNIHAVAIGPNMLPSQASQATVTITPYPILSLTCSKASVSEDGGTATFTITSSSPPAADITVKLLTGGTYTAADQTGLAASGTSFTTTLVHATTTTSLTITGVHNPTNANPTATLTIQSDSNTPPTYTVGTPSSASVLIQNDGEYTVAYSGNGSTGGTPPTDSNFYTPGTTVTVLGNSGSLVKTGYTFAGWNTQATGSGTTYAPNQTFPIGANVTLYALWTPTYSVTYSGNGSTGGTVPTDSNLYTPGTTVTVLGNSGSLVKTGYTFAGWNTQATGGGTTYAPNQTFTIGSSNVTLYALWNLIPTYSVTYSGNGSTGGTVPTDGTSYHAGDTVTVLGPGSLSNSSGFFMQWNTLSGGSGTYYSAGNTFVIGAANVTLYAIWVPVSGTTISSVPATATNVVIPEGITGFGNAFQSHADLTSVTIPSTITTIAVQPFLDCSQLATIVSNNSTYPVVNGALVDSSTQTLIVVPAKLSGAFTMPSVTSINAYAFGDCTNLSSITIPSTLTTISMNGFSGFQSQIPIVLPSTVVAIGDYGFYNCYVTTLTVSANVTSIGTSAFGACPNLTAINMQGSTPPTLGSTVFAAPLPTIHVPAGAVSAYQTSWSSYGLTIVTP
jgi:uncharacterized repeat protein (TIGR02543 family)